LFKKFKLFFKTSILEISVIIPTYNEEKYLPTLLKCISKQTLKPVEVIVSDNYSKDQTREIAKEFGAKVIDGGIQSVGRNNGAKIAKGEILIFIDADISFSDNFLKNCVKQFTDSKIDLGVCKFSLKSENFSQLIHNMLTNISMEFRKKTKNPLGNGGVIICKKKVFESVGGFDESLKISEDQKFFRLAVLKGYKFGIINLYFVHSPRRYKNNHFFNIFISGALASIIIVLFTTRNKVIKNKLLKIIEKMYGEFGKW